MESTHFNARGEVSFELHSCRDVRNEKTGKIICTMDGDEKFFTVNFDTGGCVLGERTLRNIGRDDFAMDRPFFDNLIFSPRDLFFIFLGKDPYCYAGPARISGRSVQQFVRFFDISMDGVPISAIKISIDGKFLTVLRVDFFDSTQKLVRRIAIDSFENFDGLWMPKVIEFSDLRKHCRAKLKITGAKFVFAEEAVR
ncbi:MAG: outer membrane lipoprotein-sorting protein [Puniceicoccales bacterium]|nr:outer membrane lipoprotein-sorting protein [Puniceicoccales bacterium]